MKRPFVALMAAVAVAGTASAGVGVAQAGPVPAHRPTPRSVLQADADALLTYGAPGVLVDLDTPRGDVQVRSGYGDVAARTPVPWNARFRIGSYTKPFVAATLLQLVGEGKVSLDDKVERFLPGLIRGNGNDGRRITVRQVLQHTSGVPEYTNAMTLMSSAEAFKKSRSRSWTSAELVALAMQFPPDFAPGEKWSYSNTGYVVASMIIAKVTGLTWQQAVRDRVVEPLGLRHTYLPGTSPRIPGPHAVGYQRFPGPGASPENPNLGDPVDVTLLNPSLAGAAGEMISTTDDANAFLRALVTGKVLKRAQLAEMLRTVPTNDLARSRWPGARYGLGLLWAENSCGGFWIHGGDIPGFMTRNGVTPDGSRAVTVSINTDSLKPNRGVELPTVDPTVGLIDHALCGVH